MRLGRLIAISTIIMALVVATLPSLASAHSGGTDRPFSAAGSGTTTSPGAHGCQFTVSCTTTGAGTLTGSHIGRSTFISTTTIFYSQYTSNGHGGVCAPATSMTVITAANGDHLNLSGTGTVCEVGATGNNVPHTFSGTYTVTGGTGRFTGASGSGSFSVAENNGAFSVQYSGTLSY